MHLDLPTPAARLNQFLSGLIAMLLVCAGNRVFAQKSVESGDSKIAAQPAPTLSLDANQKATFLAWLTIPVENLPPDVQLAKFQTSAFVGAKRNPDVLDDPELYGILEGILGPSGEKRDPQKFKDVVAMGVAVYTDTKSAENNEILVYAALFSNEDAAKAHLRRLQGQLRRLQGKAIPTPSPLVHHGNLLAIVFNDGARESAYAPILAYFQKADFPPSTAAQAHDSN